MVFLLHCVRSNLAQHIVGSVYSRGLPGSLIPFVLLAFVHQCLISARMLPSPSVLLPASKHFTARPGISHTSPFHKMNSGSSTSPMEFSPNLCSSTYAHLMAIKAPTTRRGGITAHAGTALTLSFQCRFIKATHWLTTTVNEIPLSRIVHDYLLLPPIGVEILSQISSGGSCSHIPSRSKSRRAVTLPTN